MEYSGRHILDNHTDETLKKLNLQEPDCKIYKKVLKNWDSIAKPLDGWEDLKRSPHRLARF